MEISREMYVDSVSSSAVQLRPQPNASPRPNSDPGICLHQVNIVTGNAAAFTADTVFWQADCSTYEVIIRRKG